MRRGDDDRPERERESSGKGAVASELVDAALAEAEEAAGRIRRESEERARRYFEESRKRADEFAGDRMREVSELTDSLVERARQLVRESDQLIAALAEAGRQVTASGRASRQPAAPARDPGDGGVSEGARLLATQMAVAGSGREQIERRLQDEFGIRDPSPILDQIGV
jgi:hypothetical protein